MFTTTKLTKIGGLVTSAQLAMKPACWSVLCGGCCIARPLVRNRLFSKGIS
ncbi:MAG: hypothetical protein ACI8Q6_001327 [Granulosicoccus sp.]|jgi:hypothetical protein